MSTEANRETVLAIYDAFGKGDVATILDALTDDVDWAAESASDALPWYGRRTGKAEVATFFEQIASGLEVTDFTPLGFATSENENEVMVVIRFHATARGTARAIDMQLHHYWRFRDGKVEYYRGSEDTAQTIAAVKG
jgi:uncharacterized protein